jgi:hypothetical protein
VDDSEPIYSESPSTNADTTSGSTTSTSGSHTHNDFGEVSPNQNPSISVEYVPQGGTPHYQLLQRSDGSIPRSYQHAFDERLSTTSSTIGGDGPDTATQHTDDRDHGELEQGDMLATMHILSQPGFYDHMLMPPFNPPQWDHLTSAERYHESTPSYLPSRDYALPIYHGQ